MIDYRAVFRLFSDATWFFTVNLAERRNNRLLIEKIDPLCAAIRYVKGRKSFHINAIVIMPDHLNCIWTLPLGDSDYSTRWNLLRGQFSHSMNKGEKISESHAKRRERGLWQLRFWAHLLDNWGQILIKHHGS